MTNRIFYHKRTGVPVQIIARAQTKPTFQEVICYQELTEPYEYYVMEKRTFFAEYVKEFMELPITEKKAIEKKEDLPDKQPRISKGEILETDEDGKLEKLLRFLDADSYTQKIKYLEEMKDELDDYMINNIAVSMDLTLDDEEDGYHRILSELKMREKYESDRGERL